MNLGATIPLLSAFSGYQISGGKKTPRAQPNIRSSIQPYNLPNETNTYSSVATKKNNQNVQKLADNRYFLSQNSTNTNIIPEAYNSISYGNVSITQPMKKTILPLVVNQENEANLHKKQIAAMMQSPLFQEATIGTTSSSTQISGFSPILSNNNSIEAFGNTNGTVTSELTGLPINVNKLNLVPHFGSTVKQNTTADKNQGILDRYTGATKCPPKREVPIMFTPVKQNVFGSQNTQDRSRYVQSNLKTGLLPLPQIKVAPLPADSVRPMYRTQEQLNVNARKVNTPITPNQGISQSQTQRGQIGNVSKNNPETSWAWGVERSVLTGSNSKEAMRENFSNGGLSVAETMYPLQPAGSNVPANIVGMRKETYNDITKFLESGELSTLSRNDKRQTGYGYGGVRNAGSVNPNKENAIERDSYKVNETQRDTTSRMTLNPATNIQFGDYQPYTQDAKVTIKQTNLFSYTGSAQSEVSAPKDYAADYNYTRMPARPTNENYQGIAGMSSAGVMNTDEYENIEIHTNKEVISDLNNYILAIDNGSKLAAGACAVNIQARDDNLGKTKWDGLGFQNRNIVQAIKDEFTQGCMETRVSRDLTEVDVSNRIDPIFVESLNSNPYNIDINRTN